MNHVKYHSAEELIKINEIALTEVKVKKADRPEVLSRAKLNEIPDTCKKAKGDVYEKAACLIKALTQKHPFASGNRRTAFLAAKDFLEMNNAEFKVANAPENSKVMQGIREDFYSSEEIINWFKNGKIRKFQRWNESRL